MVLPAGASVYTATYSVYGSGDVVVKAEYRPKMELPELPRFGMQMGVPAEFNTMTWYGRGPHESYWDRKTGASVGVWSGPVEEQFFSYVRPQETGNKTDVRWVAMTNEEGEGLLAVGLAGFEEDAHAAELLIASFQQLIDRQQQAIEESQ